jgi:ubiquinone/menaquinone biosynthesis C-methylase UbiE
MTLQMEDWEAKDGVDFLKRIGVRSGQTVADFGARVGHYAIPAGRLVGAKGRVYALDQYPKALAELERKRSSEGLDNIIVVETAGDTDLDLPAEAMDVLLLYDVLHLMPPALRQDLYKEAARVLKDSGLLSVYPKHVIGDWAAEHFKGLTARDVSREICSAGFNLRDKVCGVLSHDDALVSGCVWNFAKKSTRSRPPQPEGKSHR